MKIVLNGETRQVAPGSTLSEMLAAAGYANRRIAVEINREIVPKSVHEQRLIRDGDHIEVVHALGGG
jgi:sulfur carrier protein